MKWVLSLLGIGLGCILIIYTEWFVSNFGRSAWAEQHMGTSGGTRLLYKLVGLVFILIALLWATGFLGNIVLGIFSPLFGGII